MQSKDITITILKIFINIILFVNVVVFFLTVAVLLIDGKWLSIFLYFILFGIVIMSGYNYKQKIDGEK